VNIFVDGRLKHSAKQSPDNDIYRRKYCDILERHEIFDRILETVSSDILPDLSSLMEQSSLVEQFIPNCADVEPCETVPDSCNQMSRTQRQATGDCCYDNRAAAANVRTRVIRRAHTEDKEDTTYAMLTGFSPGKGLSEASRQMNGERATRRSRDQLKEVGPCRTDNNCKVCMNV